MSQTPACLSLVLRHRPSGAPRREDFELRSGPIPTPGPGEVVTRTIWLSIDPYMRGRLSRAAVLRPAVQPGEVMTGETVGEVIASADPRFVPGDIVVGARGWQTHSVTPADRLAKVERDGAPLSTYLGVLGMPGTTAYSGMTDIGQPKAGETVVISAASGAVGCDRRAVGQARRRARRGHRRRAGEMPVRAGGAWLRRLRGSPRARPPGRAGGRLPEGDRRLFRECRRPGAGSGLRPAQSVRPRGRCAAWSRNTTKPNFPPAPTSASSSASAC